MRESRLYGFVRGALSNERPYRVTIPSSTQRVASGGKGQTQPRSLHPENGSGGGSRC